MISSFSFRSGGVILFLLFSICIPQQCICTFLMRRVFYYFAPFTCQECHEIIVIAVDTAIYTITHKLRMRNVELLIEFIILRFDA